MAKSDEELSLEASVRTENARINKTMQRLFNTICRTRKRQPSILARLQSAHIISAVAEPVAWFLFVSQVTLTYAASVIAGLTAQYVGRPDLIRSPKRVVAHLWRRILRYETLSRKTEPVLPHILAKNYLIESQYLHRSRDLTSGVCIPLQILGFIVFYQ
jgi:hypothetical protein